MSFHQVLDAIPIFGLFLLFVATALVVGEIGYRIGRWWQARDPEETQGPTPMIVGSLLALMAFLLAVTTGMASDRYGARKALVLDEANAIGTAWLRAGYLPDPHSGAVRNLLREYLPLRIASADPVRIDAKIRRSVELQEALWKQTEALARDQSDSPVVALFVESVNETIDVHESRIMAAVYGRIPVTILMLLLFGAILTLGTVGYSAGLTRRRSPLTALILVSMLGAVNTVVIDLDRPQGGLLEVSQRPLLDLVDQIGAVVPPI